LLLTVLYSRVYILAQNLSSIMRRHYESLLIFKRGFSLRTLLYMNSPKFFNETRIIFTTILTMEDIIMDNIIDILADFGIIGIMIAAFSEAIFLPVPMEVISIATYLINPAKAFFYSIILIVFSVLGSITGYNLGRVLGKPLINKVVSAENFNKLKSLYDKNSFLTLLTSTFTPIPYEAYVLSAGIFNIGFRKFFLASTLSRVIRHLPQGILITLYGEDIISYLKNYSLFICLFIFMLIFLLKYLLKKSFIN
jgi:membrane protein YqaA with SNARE-associated domain